MTKRPSDTPEAVGAYRDDKNSGTNWLPWIIGAILLLLLIALLWWAMRDTGEGDTTTQPDQTTPNGVYENDPSGAEVEQDDVPLDGGEPTGGAADPANPGAGQ